VANMQAIDHAPSDYRMSRHDEAPRTNFRSTASILKLMACLAQGKALRKGAKEKALRKGRCIR
jgi:hypothetical protein